MTVTEIEFFGDEKRLKGFLIKNHTGYANKGKDIVCAAVSVLGQTAVLGLQEVVGIECGLKLKSGYLSCLLPNNLPEQKEAEAQIILKVLYEGLIAIEEEYGRYVRVRGVRYRENKNGSSVVCNQKRRRKYKKRTRFSRKALRREKP